MMMEAWTWIYLNRGGGYEMSPEVLSLISSYAVNGP